MSMKRKGSAAALLATALLLGACTPSGGDGEAATAGATETSPTTTTVPALTKEAYRAALVDVAKPVNAAMAKVASAAPSALPDRLDAVETAANEAVRRLDAIKPPEELEAGHGLLIHGYTVLATNVSFPGQRAAKTACDRSIAVNNVYTAASSVWPLALRELKANGLNADFVDPDRPKQRKRRRANGALIRNGARGGRGELAVDNGTDNDAVVTLAAGKQPLLSVYIQHGKDFRITGIRDGSYRVYYASGEDWAGKSFTRGCSFNRFDDPAKFVTRFTATYVESTQIRLTLQKVFGGNATTSAVDPGDYPG